MATIHQTPTAAAQDTLADHAAAIRVLGKRAIADAIEIGRRLTDVKRLVGYGGWLPWIDRELGWTEMSAVRFMQVYELGKSHNLLDLDLPVSAAYLLAAPSTPADAREEIIDRAANGEQLTHAQVKQIISEKKPLGVRVSMAHGSAS
jgi:hypothetical protein